MEKPDLGTAPIRDIVKYAVLQSKRKDGQQRKQQGKHVVLDPRCVMALFRVRVDGLWAGSDCRCLDQGE